MRSAIFAAAALIVLGTPEIAAAKSLPAGGMTIGDVVSWLQASGYKAQVLTTKDGKQNVESEADGLAFHIFLYDCKNKRCGSLQFSVGIDTKGAVSPQKINEWNVENRWVRGYTDNVNDPWLQFDIDLTPGGTYEMLDDEFDIWKSQLSKFRQYVRQ
jgi:hypothetical protein